MIAYFAKKRDFIKQCDEAKIESYITPAHLNRSVDEFNEMIKAHHKGENK